MARESFAIGNLRVRPGSKKDVELPITRLVTGGDVSLPVQIVHGKHDGPTIWVSAAIHGEEVMGVEVVRRLLATLKAKDLHGTLVAVPVVNVLGFMTGDRYLPDRRDLNRSFPGSPRGSLASRIAHLFMTEVVAKCELGIDLHTAADRRANLPQLRGDLDHPRTYELAKVFGAPLMIHAKLRDGSLRQAAIEAGSMVLLYESGEAMRFDELSIQTGVAGIRRVMKHLGMIEEEDEDVAPLSLESRDTGWIRARGTGIFQLECELGDRVEAGRRLGRTSDTFGRGARIIRADRDGVVIGLTRAPLVNAGDGLVHVAQITSHPG
jgi:predicted deacylase